METLWFCLLAFMLAMYVILDGFDLGAGILHLFIARTPRERGALIQTVGPVWDGNEVWLIGAVGSMFCAFPQLYATAFSGFYLPLMIVLWLITGRALGIEFRHQVDHPLWVQAWDAVFALSSAALALFFGVALGNVVRGVPIDAGGAFFLPLWTDFSPRHATGILDGYTLFTGLTAVAALAHHGAHWVALKSEGDLHERAHRAARAAGWVVLACTAILTIWTRFVQPHVAARFAEQPWGYVFPLIAGGGLAAAQGCLRKSRPREAFLGSAAYLAGMMASVAFGLYPFVLPASSDLARSLTVQNAAADVHGLRVALGWWIPGILLALGYAVFVYRSYRGKAGTSYSA